MGAEYKFELLTPEKLFFSGKVESLVVTAHGGEMGILAGHEPIIVALSIGPVKMLVKGAWRQASLAGGVLVVRKDKTILLTDSAEWPEEIDSARAEASKKRAEEKLVQALSKEEHALAQAALIRAVERLKLVKRLRGTGGQ